MHKYSNDRKIYKVRDHCHYTDKYRVVSHSICNLKHSIPKEIPVIFHNGLNYDIFIIIKKLGKYFEKEFDYLWENIEKFTIFSVPIIKEVKRIYKNGKQTTKSISYRLQFTDIAIFVAGSLSNLVD